MSLGRSNSTGVMTNVKRRPRPLKIVSGANRLSAIELSSVEDIIGKMKKCPMIYGAKLGLMYNVYTAYNLRAIMYKKKH